MLGLSVERVRHLTLLPDGMPRAGRDSYPLSSCVQWYIKYWKKIGEESKDREKDARIRLLENRADKADSGMISKVEVAQAAETAFLMLGKFFESLPSQLARDCQLPPEAVKKMRKRLDDARQLFAVQLKNYDPEKAPDAKPAKRA